jgi:tripartite-type tricarboxylate transporter receptor subunit TctC
MFWKASIVVRNRLFAPAATPKPVLEAVFQAVTKAMQLPETVEKLNKQNFNIVPNKSLADAKAWLADEMKHWENITSTVKIDIAQ